MQDPETLIRGCLGSESIERIDEGSYGIFFKIKFNNVTLGLKLFKNKVTKGSEYEKEIEKEFDNGKYFGNLKIGPSVYRLDTCDAYRYIIMQFYEMNGFKYVFENIKNKGIINILNYVRKFVELIRKLYNPVINNRNATYDVKFENSVVNENPLDVRLIDFDDKFSIDLKKDPETTTFYKNMLIVYLYITLIFSLPRDIKRNKMYADFIRDVFQEEITWFLKQCNESFTLIGRRPCTELKKTLKNQKIKNLKVQFRQHLL